MDNKQLPKVFKSQYQIAKFYDIDKKSVKHAVSKGYIAPESDGTFDAQKVQAWRDASKPRGTHALKQSPEMQKADLIYKRNRARKEKLIVGQLSGSLISRVDVEKQFATRAEELARNLLVLSRRIAAQLAPECKQTLAKAVEIIDAEVKLLLESYARPLDIKPQTEHKSRIRTAKSTAKGIKR